VLPPVRVTAPQRERYERAEEHCGKALAIDKDNVKALFRRARARVCQRNLDGAKEDFDRRVRSGMTQDPRGCLC
jgi:Tfp pilus assembly protein PilF